MGTKKKVFAAVLCACLLVVTSVLGTMAYLQDTDEVVNTFTVGNVQIKLDEAEIVNGVATGSRTEVGNTYNDVIPGITYGKDPTVTVLANSQDSYVRMLVTIDNQANINAVFTGEDKELINIFTGYNSEVWEYVTETVKDDTITYEFRCTEVVEKNSADTILPALFTGVKIPGDITNAELATLNNTHITVVAHAIQKGDFANADAAWAAFAA